VLAGFHPIHNIEETSMPQIGQFTRETTGFVGRVHTLTLYRELTIVPAEPSDAENAPEIGAGWKRTGERAGEYLSLLIDDPALPQPIRANLFCDDGGAAWSLHWTRPVKRGERE
jgi:uncharacterized protein (DUF736 family)